MKKKIKACILCICLMMALAGCSSLPEDTSQEMYDIGVEAMEILDDYIDGKMAMSTCESKLADLEEEGERLMEQNGDQYPNDDNILFYISDARFNSSDLFSVDGETYAHEEDRDKLKKFLGKPW